MSDVYCDIDDLKQILRITNTQTDTILNDCIEAASRAVDDQTNRRFWQDTNDVTREFLPQNPGVCNIFDLSSFTSLATRLNPTDMWVQDVDFYLEPLSAPEQGLPWTSIRTIARPFLFTRQEVPPGGWSVLDGRVLITGKWGWPSVPGPVQTACLLLSERLYKRLTESPQGIMTGGVDVPGLRVPRIDADVKQLLDPYSLTFVMG